MFRCVKDLLKLAAITVSDIKITLATFRNVLVNLGILIYQGSSFDILFYLILEILRLLKCCSLRLNWLFLGEWIAKNYR